MAVWSVFGFQVFGLVNFWFMRCGDFALEWRSEVGVIGCVLRCTGRGLGELVEEIRVWSGVDWGRGGWKFVEVCGRDSCSGNCLVSCEAPSRQRKWKRKSSATTDDMHSHTHSHRKQKFNFQ